MQTKEILNILSGKTEDGTTPTVAERIKALPPDVIIRTFDTHARLAEEVAQKQTLADVVCRLLASGMPADEIVMILGVKAEVVDDVVKYRKEPIAKYAKQLKGRRQRAKKKREEADNNGGV